MTPEQITLRIADNDELWNIRMDAEAEDCRELPSEPSDLYRFIVWLCGSNCEVKQ